MNSELKKKIESAIGVFESISPCQGGDINKSFAIKTVSGNKYFLKLNRADLEDMFTSEFAGLSLLARAAKFRVPKAIDVFTAGSESALLMEWIERGEPNDQSWQKFWRQLGELHSVHGDKFGLAMDNYIGSLPQQNDEDENWIEFWIERRISPLMITATEGGALGHEDIPAFLRVFEDVRNRYKDHVFKPRLIHGDLWSGNLIFDSSGDPVLIDPSVHYAWPEMELAFMDLFGGFSPAGREEYKPDVSADFLGPDSYAIWQIYPLLVHTILFRGMYKRRLLTTLNSI